MFFYRVLLLRECSGVAESPETLLRDVTQKVSDIEGRIALAVEVEVEQEEALAVHNDLVGVEVAVDAARRGLRRRCTEPVGGVEKPRAALAVPTDPHLADQHDRLRLSVRPRYVNLVFDHAAAPRLVPSDADRAEVDGAMLPGQPKQAALEVLLNCSRVKRQFERGHRLVTSDSEWIVHRDAHRSASPASLLHRASKRST